MKQVIPVIFLLISTTSFAQIQRVDLPKFIAIGKWRMGMRTITEMFYSVDERNDTTYHWQYDDERYSAITSYEWIDFAEEGNTLNELYNLLRDCFDKDKDYQTSFKLGEDLIAVIVQKSMGVKYLFISPKRGYFTLSKGGLDKLFGKK